MRPSPYAGPRPVGPNAGSSSADHRRSPVAPSDGEKVRARVDVQHAVDDKRRRLSQAAARVERPCLSQVGDIRCVDLVERSVPAVMDVEAMKRPIAPVIGAGRKRTLSRHARRTGGERDGKDDRGPAQSSCRSHGRLTFSGLFRFGRYSSRWGLSIAESCRARERVGNFPPACNVDGDLSHSD